MKRFWRRVSWNKPLRPAMMKNQWKAADYRNDVDLDGQRYSRTRMVQLLQERLAHVIRRGATLHNHQHPRALYAIPGCGQRDAATWAG